LTDVARLVKAGISWIEFQFSYSSVNDFETFRRFLFARVVTLHHHYRSFRGRLIGQKNSPKFGRGQDFSRTGLRANW